MQELIETLGAGLPWASGLDWPHSQQVGLLNDTSNLVFFKEVYRFVSEELDEFRVKVLGRTTGMVGGIAITLMTIWILIQGYRIVTGQMRETMAAFMVNMLRSVLILFVATTFAFGSTDLSAFLTETLNSQITYLMTGENKNSFDLIDTSLGYMQIAMSSIDQLQVGGSEVEADSKDRALWFSGIGIAGPAITGGAMLLLNKVAMALVVGLGPLFILCLLFDQTKQLFQRWLMYGLGTLFSLAVLSAMVSLALDAVLAVAAATWTGRFFGNNTEGLTSQAMQQGGLGLLMTTLIISAPPMAASFFRGVLGQFSSYNAFGGAASTPQRAGESRHQGSAVLGRFERADGDRASVAIGASGPASIPRQTPSAASVDEVKSGRSRGHGGIG